MNKKRIISIDRNKFYQNPQDKGNIRVALGKIYVGQRKEYINEAMEVCFEEETKFKQQGLMGIIQPYLECMKQAIHEFGNLNRLKDVTMMIKTPRKFSKKTTQRYMHVKEVKKIATKIARRLGLNEDLVEIMAENHDIGHTFYGHDGEWMISEYLEKRGLGCLVHNAEGPRTLLFRKEIYEKIIEKIKEKEPDIKPWKLNIIRDNLWVIFDGMLTHNGELSNTEFTPNTQKTEEDFIEDLIRCYTEKGADRKIVPATIEGCLLRISDIISYVARDFVDGLREGLIDSIDDEYMEIFESFGISREEVEDAHESGEWDSFIERIENSVIEDVIANSNKSHIRISDEMAKKVYGLRAKNNRDIVSKVTKETEQGVFPVIIETFMENGIDILINEGIIADLNDNNGSTSIDREKKEKYDRSPYVDEEACKSMVERTKDGKSKRQFKSPYIGLLEFIEQTTESDYQFTREISKIEFENAKRNSNEKQKIPANLDEVVAIQMIAQYLASLTDYEFLDLGRGIGELTIRAYSEVKKKYINSINDSNSSKYWEQNMGLQEKDLRKNLTGDENPGDSGDGRDY